MPATVTNNTARSRYELEVDGHTAIVVYTLAPGVMTLVHTEVPAGAGRAWGRRWCGARWRMCGGRG